jgi:Cys-tRNA(Pro)/Cys-tRNA(Cys) deacylase
MAKKEKEIITNAMRILTREKIPFRHFSYTCDDFVDGIQTADALGLSA